MPPLKWDVFLSHASEDKVAVARPLANALNKLGVKVWIDEGQLELGDSLRQKIDKGLAQSRFGVVILSESFFAKDWPQRELDGMIARESSTRVKVVLPVWHGVDAAYVARFSPMLAARLAVSTSRGIDHIAKEIHDVCRSSVVEVSASDQDDESPPMAWNDQRTRQEANVLKDQAIAYRQGGNLKQAEKMLNEVLDIYRHHDDAKGQANALNNLGIVYRHQGKYTASVLTHQEARLLYEFAGDRRGLGDNLRNQAIALRQRRDRGDFELAEGLLLLAKSILEDCGDLVGAAKCLNELGIVCRERGDLASAESYFEQSKALIRQLEP